ncbi:MAG: 30S ribosomal protein S17 [Kiritimatiellae bacterium]|nr:30S ribosomal protein S17 [Kiritimatiellia bacterium]MCO5060931.1 30S ribosomal protein S17 [Kiritimatiellia bacterium]MCO5068154.1 30S ribosomal protein S17 [Kiritimatiellia bacterium]
MSEQVKHHKRKGRKGTVVSDKADKTIVVSVSRRIRHAVYGKEITVSRKYHAHDENGEAKQGDTVRIEECRPMSRLKRWRLVEVIARASK